MKFRFVIFTASITFAFVLIYITGCTSSSSSSPVSMPAQTVSPNPAQTPPAQLDWAPDGMIIEGEYSGFNSYGPYSVHWRSDDQFMYIGIKANTSGWVSMALQPGSRMKDSDMVLGFVNDGKAEIQDLYCTDNTGSHPEDTELGGTSDILLYEGKEEGGSTTIEFKRLLDTGDKYDIPVKKGANKIIWAYGSGDSTTLKHTSKGYGEIAP